MYQQHITIFGPQHITIFGPLQEGTLLYINVSASFHRLAGICHHAGCEIVRVNDGRGFLL
jgi:hypothetical protein